MKRSFRRCADWLRTWMPARPCGADARPGTACLARLDGVALPVTDSSAWAGLVFRQDLAPGAHAVDRADCAAQPRHSLGRLVPIHPPAHGDLVRLFCGSRLTVRNR